MMHKTIMLGILLQLSVPLCATPFDFDATDPSGKSLPSGWEWKRENPEGWRLRDGGLEIRIEPGNMWGKKNDAKNVLLIGKWREGRVSWDSSGPSRSRARARR